MIFYFSTDIDDCALPQNDCVQKCENFVGGFQCACFQGYQLASDKKNCTDIDECSTEPDICLGGKTGVPGQVNTVCRNEVGSYACDCRNGYRRNEENICSGLFVCLFVR